MRRGMHVEQRLLNLSGDYLFDKARMVANISRSRQLSLSDVCFCHFQMLFVHGLLSESD